MIHRNETSKNTEGIGKMKRQNRMRIIFIVLAISLSAANSYAYRRGLTMITPSEQWREALPSGNGKIGALVYGSINQERVLFNHNELWYMGKIDDIPDMSAELAVVRKLMLEGKYREANDYYRNKLREKGFSARNAVYHPAFDMNVTTECERLFEDYARTLDFETGEVEVKWRDGDTRFSRRLFVSIPDDLSIMSIKADKKNAVSGDMRVGWVMALLPRKFNIPSLRSRLHG